MTHTPGPWSWNWNVDANGNADGRIFTGWNSFPIGTPVCVAVSPRYQNEKQWGEDAAMLAAAPDMLAELKRLHEKNGWQTTADLIDKAEGRTVAQPSPKETGAA